MIVPAIIDDFSVPTPAVTLPSDVTGLTTGPVYTAGAEILGGGRRTTFTINLNPYATPAHLDISEGFVKLSTGVGQFLGFDVIYGLAEDGRLRSLSDSGVGDFLSLGSTFRTNFTVGDDENVFINYNIVVWTASGWVIYGDNIEPRAFGPTTVDFPFESFRSNTGTPPDFSAVSIVLFRFQTWADFVIDSFEIV